MRYRAFLCVCVCIGMLGWLAGWLVVAASERVIVCRVYVGDLCTRGCLWARVF